LGKKCKGIYREEKRKAEKSELIYAVMGGEVSPGTVYCSGVERDTRTAHIERSVFSMNI
jgi:hypothetical protein